MEYVPFASTATVARRIFTMGSSLEISPVSAIVIVVLGVPLPLSASAVRPGTSFAAIVIGREAPGARTTAAGAVVAFGAEAAPDEACWAICARCAASEGEIIRSSPLNVGARSAIGVALLTS